MKKWEKRKSDVHYWIIKYNYEKMIVTCTDDISIDKCLWEDAQSSLSYWFWNRAKLYIAIMSKRAWVIKELCNSETDSDDWWSLNFLLWYASDQYQIDWSWESLQKLKHWVSCCEHARIWYDSWLFMIRWDWLEYSLTWELLIILRKQHLLKISIERVIWVSFN